MGQIVKRKKKGRPSKADLAHRSGSPARAPESDIRRSLRRRNVRYNIDYDDYLDEDEEDEIEEERRREKKLKLVLKLNQSQTSAESPAPSRAPSAARGRRGAYDEEEERVEEEEEEDEECEKKPVKKRRINGVDDDEEDDDEDGDHGDDDEEERGRKRAKGRDSGPGTPCDPSTGIPMPDKKSLELILDKLQKKDTYGVYAEPVDPEELPDYHDVIAHPMDFATVRKKLANGSYSILEQLENDVFLICSNAMQYNAADTIYYKQARSIQELARKKFEKIRIDIDRSEKELKSEQKVKSTFLLKKQAKKLLSRAIQEPVGSDFSSGATLATAGDVQNGPIATQAGGSERPSNTDVLVEGNSSLADNNLEKAEELSSGKGLLSKFGRKLYAADENRRATYNISNQPVVRSDSIFATFEGEIKQFVAVGLHAENSYARSLARFAATLGPVAWKVASQRIEQALPSGCKFGRGWVGEYEPLPTPVLMLETRAQKESPLFTKLQCTADVPKDNVPVKIPAPTKEQPTSGPNLEGKPSFLHPATGHASDGKPSFVVSPGIKSNSPFNAIKQPQNPHSRTFVEPENKVCKQVELNFPPLTSDKNADIVSERNPGKSGTIAFRSREMVTKNMALQQSAALKQLDNNGVTNGGLPNGKVASNSLNTRLVSSSSDAVPNQMAQAATFFSHMQGQGLSDPVQLMRMLTEKAQKQQNPSSQPPIDCPSAMPSVSSVKRDDSSNAAAAAARAWMSIGAGGCKQGTENSSGPKSQISVESLYNPAREFHPQISRIRGEFPLSAGMQFSPESNNFPLQGFPAQPVCATNEARFQNRPMIFPQLVTADLSRFQMQSPWRGLSPHVQPRQKKETLPPDLNIGFQSPGSPVKQSSGMLVDSQQPDLALQL